jgi:REP element-mobilizing transposase RayT
MHSFTSCLMHCVWATKERRPLIELNLQRHLWPYLGGIARENKMRALIVGGVEDHVHVLLSIPATLSIAKSIQLLKGILQNGFMTRLRSIGILNGKMVMAHSALESLEPKRRLSISKLRLNIIGR